MEKRIIAIFMGIIVIVVFISCSKKLVNPISINDISITSITSDFKMSPDTSLPEGSEFFNVSIASDPINGFLVTWQNSYFNDDDRHCYRIYACRVSETGEMLDNAAICIGIGSWPDYEPKAIFEGGNWIISSSQGGWQEWAGVQRLTPNGDVLDTLAINVCNSIGLATLQWPTIATNGNEILCVTGAAGSGLYGSIFDSDLNIIIDRFLVYANAEGILKLSANGNDFYLTFTDMDVVKLIIISNNGQILSVQDVGSGAISEPRHPHSLRSNFTSIQVHNNVTDVSYLEDHALWSRRYSMSGNPVDSNPIRLMELDDFVVYLESYYWWQDAFMDKTCINDCFYFFLPKSAGPGISMFCYESDLSEVYEEVSLGSQCQLLTTYDNVFRIHSFIRAASIGNKVLTAWIDGRDGLARIYANLFEITENLPDP